MKAPPQISVDIAIVGAGLVGAPLAHMLAADGWSVALISEKEATKPVGSGNDGLSQRCTALNLGTQQLFATHQLWQFIEPDACPIEHVQVSHKGYFGSTRLHARELGVKALGYVVNNDHLSASLIDELKRTTVRYIPNAKVKAVESGDEGINVHYASSHLCARLLVAADGVSSVVRESLGVRTQQIDYDQFGVLGALALEHDHHNVAYERFTSSGPLALLPRRDRIMSFVECIDAQDVHAISAMSNDAYLERLQSQFGYRLGRFKATGARFVTPLIRIEATQQVAHRTILLGNAMRLLHPVGGQGYNLAVRDLVHLQHLLAEQTMHSPMRDPGHPDLLARFVKERSADQRRTVQFTDALVRGFRGRSALPSHIRALGMFGLDTVSPLRRRFARMTMGLTG